LAVGEAGRDAVDQALASLEARVADSTFEERAVAEIAPDAGEGDVVAGRDDAHLDRLAFAKGVVGNPAVDDAIAVRHALQVAGVDGRPHADDRSARHGVAVGRGRLGASGAVGGVDLLPVQNAVAIRRAATAAHGAGVIRGPSAALGKCQ